MVHLHGVRRHQVGKKDVVFAAIARRQLDQPRQHPRHGHHSHVIGGSAAAPAQQQRLAQRFIDDARKRVGGIDGHWSEQRIKLALAVFGDKRPLLRREFPGPHDANAFLGQFWPQRVVPAAILIAHELVGQPRHQLCFFLGSASVRSRIGLAVLYALHQAAYSNLEELVEIAGGDGQKLDPFQQRVAWVLGFLQHAAVEGKPRRLAIQH